MDLGSHHLHTETDPTPSGKEWKQIKIEKQNESNTPRIIFLEKEATWKPLMWPLLPPACSHEMLVASPGSNRVVGHGGVCFSSQKLIERPPNNVS
jgi:hypothetical protein